MAGKVKTNEVILQSPNGLQEAKLSLSDSGVVSSDKTVTLASPTITGNITKDGLPMFACRAWVNFGSSGVIRASGNIASIVFEGSGIFKITFTEPMPDANYSVVGNAIDMGNYGTVVTFPENFTNTYFKVRTPMNNGAGYENPSLVTLAIFR